MFLDSSATLGMTGGGGAARRTGFPPRIGVRGMLSRELRGGAGSSPFDRLRVSGWAYTIDSGG